MANAEWIDYRIFDLMPEVPEGHEFRSKVPNLEQHPELWAEECPYSIPRGAEPTVERK